LAPATVAIFTPVAFTYDVELIVVALIVGVERDVAVFNVDETFNVPVTVVLSNCAI
jgi:hypothetical protein